MINRALYLPLDKEQMDSKVFETLLSELELEEKQLTIEPEKIKVREQRKAHLLKLKMLREQNNDLVAVLMPLSTEVIESLSVLFVGPMFSTTLPFAIAITNVSKALKRPDDSLMRQLLLSAEIIPFMEKIIALSKDFLEILINMKILFSQTLELDGNSHDENIKQALLTRTRLGFVLRDLGMITEEEFRNGINKTEVLNLVFADKKFSSIGFDLLWKFVNKALDFLQEGMRFNKEFELLHESKQMEYSLAKPEFKEAAHSPTMWQPPRFHIKENLLHDQPAALSVRWDRVI